MAENDSVSIADSDSAVAGSSVAITEAEEDITMESLTTGDGGVVNLSSSSAPVEERAGATTSSITATDASAAGSSVAVTEVEEDILCSSAYSAAADDTKKIVLTKDSSLDLSICNQKDEDEDDDENEEDVAPMHLHALRSPAKLKGAPRSRSSSRSRPGSRNSSRKNSPQPRGQVPLSSTNLVVGTTVSPSASVSSSLDGSTGVGEHVIDPDLLLDKLGLRDLDANASHDEIQEMLKKHISSNNGLPTLNERLSEETLDDVHAFQDLVASKKGGSSSSSSSSSGNDGGNNSPGKALRASQGPSSRILEVALDALTEEDEDDDLVEQSERKSSTSCEAGQSER